MVPQTPCQKPPNQTCPESSSLISTFKTPTPLQLRFGVRTLPIAVLARAPAVLGHPFLRTLPPLTVAPLLQWRAHPVVIVAIRSLVTIDLRGLVDHLVVPTRLLVAEHEAHGGQEFSERCRKLLVVIHPLVIGEDVDIDDPCPIPGHDDVSLRRQRHKQHSLTHLVKLLLQHLPPPRPRGGALC